MSNNKLRVTQRMNTQQYKINIVYLGISAAGQVQQPSTVKRQMVGFSASQPQALPVTQACFESRLTARDSADLCVHAQDLVAQLTEAESL